MTETLQRFRRREIKAKEAVRVTLEALGGGVTLIGLCATPTQWRFARLSLASGAVAADTFDGPLDFAALFDLRAFLPNGEFELRWRRDGLAGAASWVTTGVTVEATTLGAKVVDPVQAKARPDSSRLLFGTQAVAGARPGWVMLSEARTGAIAVPFDGPPGRLRLTGREFIARDPEFGNAYVAEEILTGIVRLETPT